MPPQNGSVVQIRPGISFGHCFLDYKNPLPSCPYLTVSKKDSIWELSRNQKVVHIYKFSLKVSGDVIHVDNAFLNLTFSAPNDLQIPSDSKVSIDKILIRDYKRDINDLANELILKLFLKVLSFL